MKLQSIEAERQSALRRIESQIKAIYSGKEGFLDRCRVFKCQGVDLWFNGHEARHRFKRYGSPGFGSVQSDN